MVHEIIRRHLNQPAKLTGIVGLCVYLSLGYLLKIKLTYDYANWTNNYALLRGYLRAAHVHGLTLSFLIIFYAFLIEFSGLGDKLKKVAVTLAISGVILMPITLVLSGFGIKILILSHISIIMIISSVFILAAAHIKKGLR